MGVGDNFRDENGCTCGGSYFHPRYMDNPDWKEKEKKILEAAATGMHPRHAFQYGGIHEVTYYDWKNHFEEDLSNGIIDSPLVKFMFKLMVQNEKLHKELLDKGKEIALEGNGNPEMIKYLLGKVYKYDSTKQEVELKTEDDTTFNINIVPSEKEED